ncbi:MAG: glycoside hydrolase family 3 C-terminal domain-containing protein [Lachnospiraceae bacterium]|nr:glycoside hydrolase family 3 C-terminal domain-containing protein [Lachnospiraceae bacterium]
MQKLTDLLPQLTLEEKITIIHAAGLFRTGGVARLNIPGLHMSDGPNGIRQEFEDNAWQPKPEGGDYASWLPSNTCLASTWNPELAFCFGQVLGNEARGRGKDIVLAPGVNIKRTPLCGRNFEYFSEDPVLTGTLAASLVHGIQENDVAACVKHFALNNQEQNRLEVEVEIDEKTLHELYLPAFYDAAVEGGSLSIMGAYNRYHGEFCCESRKLLQEILRDKWHYDGVTISDWGGVHHTEETALHGVDIEMSVTSDFDNYQMASPLYEKIKAGEIPEAAIDEKVLRILSLMDKLRMNEPYRRAGGFNLETHHQTIERIAAEGIVLLKNEKEHLPLQAGSDATAPKKILVVGDNATRSHASGGGSAEVKALYEITPFLGIRMTLGGNTVCDWLPGYYVDNEEHLHVEGGDWQADSLNEYHHKSGNPENLSERIHSLRKQYLEQALAAAPDYDEVIFIGGLNHSFDVEGVDRPDMKLPYGQDEVIAALADKVENLTVVLINGSPVEMPWAHKVHSLLQTSYCGMHGGLALAKVLFGDINPSGKLPETYPLRLADTPTCQYHSYPGEPTPDGHPHVVYSEKLMVGYRYYTTRQIPVLFPFGHGLSYTSFSCQDFQTEIQEQTDEWQVTVSCEIQNTGQHYGKETLQLYVGIPEEGQPKMALRSFAKIALESTEKQEVSLTLSQRDFATYSVEEGRFIAWPGNYTLYLGTSSENILYETSVKLPQKHLC